MSLARLYPSRLLVAHPSLPRSSVTNAATINRQTRELPPTVGPRPRRRSLRLNSHVMSQSTGHKQWVDRPRFVFGHNCRREQWPSAVTLPNSANVEFAIKSTVIGALVAAVAAANAATRASTRLQLRLSNCGSRFDGCYFCLSFVSLNFDRF